MHQAIRRHLIMTYAISLGLMTVFVSLLQPIPSASAQQPTRPVSQEIGETGTQGRRIENMATILRYPTKSLEKKDKQTSTHKPHRLIRKPQNLPTASVEPFPLNSSPISSVPPPPLSPQSENTTSQSKEPSSHKRSIGTAVPLASISVEQSPTAATGSTAVSTEPTGTIPLATAGSGNSSASGTAGAGGRTMRRLSAEMSGLAQLISPPSAPVLSGGPAIAMSPTSLSFTAQAGGNPAAQTLTISNTGRGTLRWSAIGSAPWLTLSPGSGTGNGLVTVTAATGSLAVGTHSGTVTLSGGTGVTPVTVPVSFTVSAAPVPPAIGASPTESLLCSHPGRGQSGQSIAHRQQHRRGHVELDGQ